MSINSASISCQFHQLFHQLLVSCFHQFHQLFHQLVPLFFNQNIIIEIYQHFALLFHIWCFVTKHNTLFTVGCRWLRYFNTRETTSLLQFQTVPFNWFSKLLQLIDILLLKMKRCPQTSPGTTGLKKLSSCPLLLRCNHYHQEDVDKFQVLYQGI